MSSSEKVQLLNTLTNILTTDKILLPESEDYKTSNGSYFTAFGNEIRPSYIAKPTSVGDVSKLVHTLHPFLISGDCRIAIRGGGHTAYGSSANIEGGVTVDLRGLKGITISEDKSTVEISVGETWTTVYKELEKYGLTTAGGRVGRVGVTGFVLGGEILITSLPRNSSLTFIRWSFFVFNKSRICMRLCNRLRSRPRIRRNHSCQCSREFRPLDCLERWIE
jgi:hypothetical protein